MAKKVTPEPAALGKQPKVKAPGKYTGPTKPAAIPLTLEERTELKSLLGSAVYRKAFTNARLFRPSVFIDGLNTALGPQIALGRLRQLQGWEMFEAALVLQTQDPKQKAEPIMETWPDQPM
jgi:hypothetical protein